MIIAASFIAAGICLLTVQYLLVSQLFDQAVATSATRVVQGVACTGLHRHRRNLRRRWGARHRDVLHPAGSLPASPPHDDGYPPADIQLAVPATAAGISRRGAGRRRRRRRHRGVWFEAQSSELVNDVLTRLLVFSGVVLVVFAVAAAGIAWWLARRSLKRIGEVTAMAQEVSTTDLHRRLELPGRGTRSRNSPTPSTPCWTGWSRPSPRRIGSWPTPLTSFAPR